MIKDTDYFIQAVRQLTNLEDDPIVTDLEITDRLSEALSALYDLIIGAYEHYAVTSVDFSLVGGIGANTFDLPTDFYKDVSLDRNPNSQPQTVHRFGSWVQRNSVPAREYTLMGSQLIVNPPVLAAGDYKFCYTPLIQTFFDSVVTPSVTARTIVLAIGDSCVNSHITPPLSVYLVAGGGFLASDTGKTVVISGFSDPVNNGTFTIYEVIDANTISVQVELTGETLSTAGAAIVYTADKIVANSTKTILTTGDVAVNGHIDPDLSSYLISGGTFSASDIGRKVNIEAFTNPVNNGTYVITDAPDASTLHVAEIFDFETLTLDETQPPVFATVFDNTGTATWTFANATFDASYIGGTLTVSGFTGTLPENNNGSFEIIDVPSSHEIVTEAGTYYVSANLTADMTVNIAPPNTINILPQIFTPWYEYIQVHAAIAVKDKIEQDTSTLEMRLGKLTKRVEAMAANRMEEGGQVPLTRSTGYFGDDGFGFD